MQKEYLRLIYKKIGYFGASNVIIASI